MAGTCLAASPVKSLHSYTARKLISKCSSFINGHSREKLYLLSFNTHHSFCKSMHTPAVLTGDPVTMSRKTKEMDISEYFSIDTFYLNTHAVYCMYGCLH